MVTIDQSYRTHERGPLCRIVRETIRQDEPGHIKVIMTADRPGAQVPGHVHPFDHTMRVKSGSLLVHLDGATTELRAPAEMLIVAGKRHGLTFLAPDTVAECDHEIRKANGDRDPTAFSADGIPLEWVQRLTETWGFAP